MRPPARSLGAETWERVTTSNGRQIAGTIVKGRRPAVTSSNLGLRGMNAGAESHSRSAGSVSRLEASWKPQPPGFDPPRPAKQPGKPVFIGSDPYPTRSHTPSLADGKEGVIGSSPMLGFPETAGSGGRSRPVTGL